MKISVPMVRNRLKSFFEIPPAQAVKNKSASSAPSFSTCISALANNPVIPVMLSVPPRKTGTVFIPVSTISDILTLKSPVPFPLNISSSFIRILYVAIETEDTERKIGLRVKALPVGYILTFKVSSLALILLSDLLR